MSQPGSSLEKEIERWCLDRSNGDADNLTRSIRVDYIYTAPLRKHRFAAVGIRQQIGPGWSVIASTESGGTVEAAIRRMLRAYWKEIGRKR
jgi:hypothetical protein